MRPNVISGLFDDSRKHHVIAKTAIYSLLALSQWPSYTVAKSASDYFVHSLPGAPPGPLLKMHAGQIEVDAPTHANLFFWHFQNRHIANRQRTVIWLNGGPGCSSEDGALMEIGPYRLKDTNNLEYNPGSWDEFANIMFVDNPVGTGFSSVDSNGYLHDLPDMANQFVLFLEKFFELFPEYEMDDLYFAGESYAGQHIPYIVKAILDRNKKQGIAHAWSMKGMLIGNGWISPLDQYMAYLPYAYEAGLVVRESDVAKRLEAQQSTCLQVFSDTNGKDKVDTPQCELILQKILSETQTQQDGKAMCVNMYDVKLKDTYPSCGMNWPPDLTNVTPYLRRKEVTRALNLGDVQQPGWTECNGPVGAAFRTAKSKPSIQILPEVVEQVPTVLFSGANDLICNHLGTEELINNMNWNGGKGFEISPGNWAPRQDWVFEGEAAGIYQEARNLTYVLFYNSSHMVPFDYARRTRAMLDKFMNIDIGSIGGTPSESLIDGEKGPETSVGGHPNSTAAQEAEKAKIAAAKWHAYYKSGQIVLVLVIIAALAGGFYVWRDRRRAGYAGLFGVPSGLRERGMGDARSGMGLEGFRRKGTGHADVEAADFDEAELDDLHVSRPGDGDERYSIGSSDGYADEDEDAHKSSGKGSR